MTTTYHLIQQMAKPAHLQHLSKKLQYCINQLAILRMVGLQIAWQQGQG